MGHFEIRVAQSRDWDGIAAGYARVSERDARLVRQKLAHSMEGNPHGCSSLVAVDTDGRVVGHLGVSHVPMRVKGEPHLFGRFNACFIERAFRAGGVHSLFFELDRLFQEEFEVPARLSAVFGQWDEIDWWFLRHLRDHKALATSIDLCHAAELTPAQRPGDERIRIVRGAVESAPSAPLRGGDCHVRREGSFDVWRAAFPGAADLGWQVWRGSELTGVAITRDRGGERLILDWALTPGDADAGHALLRALIAAARTSVRARFWTSDLFTLTLFQDAGFSVSAGAETHLAVRTVLSRINHQWLAQAWQVTLADAGVSPLPRLTVGEPIVYPPPPGTLDGHGRYGH